MSDRFRGAQVRDEDLGELCDHIAHDADEVAVGVGATVLLVLLSLVPQQARDPRKTSDPAIPPERVGTGTLAGRVTTLDGFEPIRHANVFLMGRTTGVIRITWSDANGRFLFGQLAPDAYIVGASKPPYLGSVAGARRPARPGTPIALGADQALLDVHIQMPLGAAIAGVIADEDGRPAPNLSVALWQWRTENGERMLRPAADASVGTTDDRGAYRFHGLRPGEYIVSAVRASVPHSARALAVAEVDSALQGQIPPVTSPADPPRPMPVYFPGTPRVLEALPISVSVGEERLGADFRLQLVPSAKVEGRILATDGTPFRQLPFPLVVTKPTGIVSVAVVRTDSEGKFSYVAGPGEHLFQINGGRVLAGLAADARVVVAGADILDMTLQLQPWMTLAGKLMLDQRGRMTALPGHQVSIRSLRSRSAVGLNVGVAAADGSFNIENIAPGRYLIHGALSPGSSRGAFAGALQSVLVDGRDVTDLPIDISADNPPRQLTVVYGDRYQELSGRLVSVAGAPLTEFTIIVFPENRDYWLYGSRRIVTSRPATDGHFILSGPGPTTLPPGRYLLAAVDDVSSEELFDPAFLSQLVSRAIPISLGPGEKKVQDLVIK